MTRRDTVAGGVRPLLCGALSMLLVACGGDGGGNGGDGGHVGGGGGNGGDGGHVGSGGGQAEAEAGDGGRGGATGSATTQSSGTAPAPAGLTLAREAYAANCVTCHGKVGRGDGPLVGALPIKPRSFAADEWRFVDFKAGDAAVRAEIARVIREGISDAMMPANASTLSEEQIAGLVDYVLELRRTGRGG